MHPAAAGLACAVSPSPWACTRHNALFARCSPAQPHSSRSTAPKAAAAAAAEVGTARTAAALPPVGLGSTASQLSPPHQPAVATLHAIQPGLIRPQPHASQQQQQQQQQHGTNMMQQPAAADSIVRPTLRPPVRPGPRVATPAKLFSNVDAFIQAYSRLQVTVQDMEPHGHAYSAPVAAPHADHAQQASELLSPAGSTQSSSPSGQALTSPVVASNAGTSSRNDAATTAAASSGNKLVTSSRRQAQTSLPAAGQRLPDASAGRSSSGSAASTSGRGDVSPAQAQALSSFEALGARPYGYSLQLRRRMVAAGYNMPTPIQRHAIPYIHAGRDVLAMAHTGTGKTAAYLVPLVGRLMRAQRCKLPRNTCLPAAVVLMPTRELAQQVLEELQSLIHATHLKAVMLAGGSAIADQMLAMRGGADIIVATPGRLVEHVSRGSLVLRRVTLLVIDEADKMLDLGFEPELQRLLGDFKLPAAPVRQTVMLCATLPAPVRQLAVGLLTRPVLVQVGAEGGSAPVIAQRLELLSPAAKLEQLLQLTAAPSHQQPAIGRPAAASPQTPAHRPMPAAPPARPVPMPGAPAPAAWQPQPSPVGTTVVFTNSVASARKVHALLASRGLATSLLHGELPQASRDEAITCFKFGVTSILVATGVASRGLDIPDVGHVINFDVPPEADEYVHRIGRTGRAGRSGVATTLFTPADAAMAAPLADVLRASGQEVPAWLEALAAQQPQEEPEAGNAQAAADSSPAAAAPTLAACRQSAAQASSSNSNVTASTDYALQQQKQLQRQRRVGVRVSLRPRRPRVAVRDWQSSWSLGFGQYLPPARPALDHLEHLLLGRADSPLGLSSKIRKSAGVGRESDSHQGLQGASSAAGVAPGQGRELASAPAGDVMVRWQKAIYGRSKEASSISSLVPRAMTQQHGSNNHTAAQAARPDGYKATTELSTSGRDGLPDSRSSGKHSTANALSDSRQDDSHLGTTGRRKDGSREDGSRTAAPVLMPSGVHGGGKGSVVVGAQNSRRLLFKDSRIQLALGVHDAAEKGLRV